jgi:hypothetical protein
VTEDRLHHERLMLESMEDAAQFGEEFGGGEDEDEDDDDDDEDDEDAEGGQGQLFRSWTESQLLTLVRARVQRMMKAMTSCWRNFRQGTVKYVVHGVLRHMTDKVFRCAWAIHPRCCGL